MRAICAVGLLALSLLSAVPQGAFAADLFGRAEPSNERSVDVAPPPALLPGIALPGPVRVLIGAAAAMQSRLNAEMRGQLQMARDGTSWRPALAILAIAFLYGVFHAVGPGHGKVVVGSYFLTRRARLLHGLAMSGSAAFVQSCVAVVLVSLLAAVFERGARQILAQAAMLEIASYAVIVLLGLWMIWGVISRRRCCAHADDAGHVHGAEGHHHHDHDHHDHDHHDHDHHDHSDHDRAGDGQPAESLLRVVLTGAAVGVRPCSGAILVLLFTLANDIYPIGIAATFAMGMGVALTVSTISLGTLGAHRALSALGGGRTVAAGRLHRAAALAGAAFITLFGLLQLLGIWSGLIVPMAG